MGDNSTRFGIQGTHALPETYLRYILGICNYNHIIKESAKSGILSTGVSRIFKYKHENVEAYEAAQELMMVITVAADANIFFPLVIPR